MADAMVETPNAVTAPHRRAAPSAIPTLDNFEGVSVESDDDYATLKKLQRQLEYIQLQEEYIKDEQRWGCDVERVCGEELWRLQSVC